MRALLATDLRIVFNDKVIHLEVRRFRFEVAGKKIRVVHEKPADQIMCVTDAGVRDPVRRKQQSNILDAAAGKHIGLRLQRDLAAIQGCQVHMSNPVRVILLKQSRPDWH